MGKIDTHFMTKVSKISYTVYNLIKYFGVNIGFWQNRISKLITFSYFYEALYSKFSTEYEYAL